MNLAVAGLGTFFAVEGAANLVWWRLHPPADRANSKMQTVWEWGRVVRTLGGLALVGIGLFA